MKEVKNFQEQQANAAKIMDAMRDELLKEGFVETAPEIFTREAKPAKPGKRRRRHIRLRYGSREYPL